MGTNMNKYRVTPYVLGGVQDGLAMLDEEQPRQVVANSSIQAALQYRVPKVQFWVVRQLQ